MPFTYINGLPNVIKFLHQKTKYKTPALFIQVMLLLVANFITACGVCGCHNDKHPLLLWPLLLSWFNFNPSMGIWLLIIYAGIIVKPC